MNDVRNTPVGKALRLLQRYDELAGISVVEHRPLLMRAMTLLGGELGLVCTGEDEGGGWYDHDGDTCPIHEWLDPRDAKKVVV